MVANAYNQEDRICKASLVYIARLCHKRVQKEINNFHRNFFLSFFLFCALKQGFSV